MLTIEGTEGHPETTEAERTLPNQLGAEIAGAGSGAPRKNASAARRCRPGQLSVDLTAPGASSSSTARRVGTVLSTVAVVPFLGVLGGTPDTPPPHFNKLRENLTPAADDGRSWLTTPAGAPTTRSCLPSASSGLQGSGIRNARAAHARRGNPDADPRGDAGDRRQGSPPGPAADAERAPGGTPGRPPRRRRAQRGRAGRRLQRHPLHAVRAIHCADRCSSVAARPSAAPCRRPSAPGARPLAGPVGRRLTSRLRPRTHAVSRSGSATPVGVPAPGPGPGDARAGRPFPIGPGRRAADEAGHRR